MDDCGYREVEHTADWALKVWARHEAELFRCAAQGMLSLLGAEASGPPSDSTELELSAEDRESLLVIWLEEILFILEHRSQTCTGFKIEVSPKFKLRATLELASHHPIRKQIKAVTYHELRIKPKRGGLETTIVFDV